MFRSSGWGWGVPGESVRDKGPEREEKSKEMSLTFRTAFPFEEFDNFQRRGRPERLKN